MNYQIISFFLRLYFFQLWFYNILKSLIVFNGLWDMTIYSEILHYGTV